MRWNEDWRRAQRPAWEDVKEYSTLWPTGRARWIALFFLGSTLLHYAATWLAGYSSRLYLGLPALYWLSIGSVVLFFAGMWVLILGSETDCTPEGGERSPVERDGEC